MIRSAGEDYGDDAVGYVQLMCQNGLCEVAACITPEHKVTAKPYRVVAVINESDNEIISAKCQDCIAAQGPCKHSAALLGWLERRNAEKAVTSTPSYWKKARLSEVNAETKVTMLPSMRKRIRKRNEIVQELGEEFFRDTLTLSSHSGLIFDYFGINSQQPEYIGIDNLLKSYLKGLATEPSSEQFMNFCKTKMTPDVCKLIEKTTQDQAKSPFWHAMRFARITASKAYSVTNSTLQSNSTLVMSVIGATKIRDTSAMKRGRDLEPKVLKEVTKQVGCIVPSGIILDGDLPVIGASPDGITKDGMAIIEVKCPTSDRNFRKYVRTDGIIAAKHLTQAQMLMHMARKNMALFCVADPNFETNKYVQIIKVKYDSTCCTKLIRKCLSFWEENIFVELCKSYGTQS